MSENKSSCSQKEKKEKEGDTPKIPERCKEEFEAVKYCFSQISVCDEYVIYLKQCVDSRDTDS